MDPRLVRLEDLVPRPWKNGGGRARDLLVSPAGAAWQVQVSVAEVDSDGPFSHYPDVERWFAVVAGSGVELDVDGTRRRLTQASAPFRFDGSAATSCRLHGGPTRDLNLMLRRASGAMAHALAGQPWCPQAARCGLYTAMAGDCLAAGVRVALPAHSFIWYEVAPAELSFVPNDAARRDGVPAAWWLAATPETTA